MKICENFSSKNSINFNQQIALFYVLNKPKIIIPKIFWLPKRLLYCNSSASSLRPPISCVEKWMLQSSRSILLEPADILSSYLDFYLTALKFQFFGKIYISMLLQERAQ